MTQYSHQAAAIIQQRCPGFTPKLGMVLGSGILALADALSDVTRFAYDELPGFPHEAVSGHGKHLLCGYLHGVPVVCLEGRYHYYQDANAGAVLKTMIRTLKLLGCDTLIQTNAAGSLNPDVRPGEIALIRDHINFSFNNPLAGANDDEFGARFFPMDNAYDANLRAAFHKAASAIDIQLSEGVYIGVLGPNFETPAEIRAFQVMGADLVGMSTVPGVLIARHCGLTVVGLSVITNMGAGMENESLSHEGTLKYGQLGAKNLIRLIVQFTKDVNDARG